MAQGPLLPFLRGRNHLQERSPVQCAIQAPRVDVGFGSGNALEKTTKYVLGSFTAEFQLGKRVSAVLDAHPDIRLLLRTLQVVSRGASWTDHESMTHVC